ncbi:hypothetical protein EON64_03860 [archaeon]|nr:MAG: hypothetical protein EON64_03860 [archaeon]
MWASDSESSLGRLSSTAKSAEYYRKLYLTEVSKRKELEQIIEKQDQEIRELKVQLSQAAANAHQTYSVEYDDIIDQLSLRKGGGDEENELAPQDDSEPAHPSVSSSNAIDARWMELAQAEKERKNKARRHLKGKSLRLPLSAAAQLAQQHRTETNNINSHYSSNATNTTDHHQAAADAIHADALDAATTPPTCGLPTDPNSTLDTLSVPITFDDEVNPQLNQPASTEPITSAQLGLGSILSAEEKQRIRSMRKRNVRHDTQLKRLNIKTQQKDLGTKGIVGGGVEKARTETSHKQHTSLDSAMSGMSHTHYDDIHFSSEDSGWDSGDDLFPSKEAASSSHTPSITPPLPELPANSSGNHSVHTSSIRTHTHAHTHTHTGNFDEAAIDSMLISWVRGKSLPVLLSTLQEVAPAHTIPVVVTLDLQDCNVGDIRKAYL